MVLQITSVPLLHNGGKQNHGGGGRKATFAPEEALSSGTEGIGDGGS